MDETNAEYLLGELFDRGLVPNERIDEVERLRDSGEIWRALEYAMKGEISERWRPAAEIV